MYAQQQHHPGGPPPPGWGPPPPDAHYQGGHNVQHPPHHYQYAPRQDHQNPPPHSQNIRPDRPEMTTVNPAYAQPPMDPYRLPAPSNLYQPQYQHGPPQSQPQVNVTQSAPRQRTAIACKYCRRRKIRCSGFEASEDGRCTNCVRFSQECVFTPVSHQTQAFVPAQAVYGRGARNPNGSGPPQLYGAYGQRLPPQPQDPYGPPGYPLPSPNGYPPPPQQPYPPQPYMQPAYAQPPPQYDPQTAQAGTRRSRDEPHTPTLPPPNPGPSSHLAAHREHDSGGYAYPDPTGFANGTASPASSNASYQSHPQPYYASQPPRRSSPGSANYYEQSRGSHSPHGQGAYAYGQSSSQPQQGGVQAPDGRTPPPNSSVHDNGAARNGVSIRDIVSKEASGERRSTTDNDMVSALNRTARR